MAERRLVLALALAALVAIPVAAAEPEPLTLQAALERAGAEAPALAAARAGADAAEARAEAGARQRWPRLVAESRLAWSDWPSMLFAQRLDAGIVAQEDFDPARLNAPDVAWHLGTTVAVEAPVDLWGRIGTAAEAGRAAARAARAGSDAALRGVRLQVTAAYWRAALARRGVDVARRALAAAQAREADMEKREAQGDALRSDLLRAKARRREREADLAAREGDAQVAAAVLARAIGTPGAALQAVDEVPAPEPVAEPAEALVAHAAERPEVVAARERGEAAAGAARAESFAARPELGVAVALRDDRRDGGSGQSFMAGAGVRWSWDAGRDKRIAAARADEQAARAMERDARAQVELEVRQAHAQAEAAHRRWLAARGGAEEMREALRVVRERRGAGLATLTDELETEAAAISAELGEIAAAADAAVARAALRHAAGEL
ncbi:MAG: TolC family protein [Vicinamibacteria bacterium]|nr:TolC family protein [Vicinamibacteria bacterium]